MKNTIRIIRRQPAMRLLLVGLLVLAGGLGVAVAASAQGGISATPSQLSVAETRGSVETRTLLLRASDPITSLHIIPLDLVHADGAAVLPARAIRAQPPVAEIAAGDLLTVPITFDLRGAPSGAFAGDLVIDYHGGSLTVPLTVTVKDPWLPPLIVLVTGVVLGVGVSAYRAQGRPRDEVLVRVGQIQARIRGDTELAEKAKPFQVQIEAHLVDVGAALQAEKWDDAQSAVTQAEATWLRWRRGRADWLAQLAYHNELEQRLEELNPNARYVQTVRRWIEDTLRDIPDLDGPDALRERLEGLAGQINRYVRLDARLNDFNQMIAELPAYESATWRHKSLALQRQLDALTPGDEDAYQALQNEVEQTIADATVTEEEEGVEELVPSYGRVVPAAREAPGLSTTAAQLLAPAPSTRALSTEEQASDARTRLRLFTWASYGLAVALLAGAGFGELYAANATFGANAWGDYFALLAWGFGAEATRAAVADMVRNWGLPGGKG